MYIKSDVMSNSGNLVKNAISVVTKIEIQNGMIAFLLSSHDADEADYPFTITNPSDEGILPFKAAFYHCIYDGSSGNVFEQCFNYLITLNEFKLGVVKAD